jgi:FkbM family methyltransferase
MEKLKTRNYLQKRITHFLLNDEWYNRIKLLKIIWRYKLRKRYEMSPILKYIISSDSIVLDIGANMGQYACRLNDIVSKGTGHVYSFEPVTANYSSLNNMKNKLGLKHVTINQLGVSNDNKDTTINIPIFNNGLVVGTRATLLNIGEIKHKTEVIKVTTIDSYIREKKIKKIDFIKCDTEGNEINVLEGGKETIKRDLPTLSFEMSYKNEGLNWLLDLDYELFYYDTQINKLRKINGYQSGNLVLINRKKRNNLDKIIKNV